MTGPSGLKGKTKITQIGNSMGVILPKEVLAALKVAKGDQLSLVQTRDGIELRPYDAEFEEEMELARRIMKKYRNALSELAK
ncbi:MAG: AbrB/MazE/SpoVT family DNA-binding domain-containing protein [Pseudomonadota bacterium]